MKRWFGLPRWIVAAAVIGLVGFGAVYGPWAQPSAQVRTIVDGLRGSSVYEAPGAPGVVNAARARAVIGNRPIVMAVLGRSPLPSTSDDPRKDLCEQLAEQLPTDYVWVYAQDSRGAYAGDDCYGDRFPRPTKAGVSMDDFDIELNIEAETSAQYRKTDQNLTPQIEEFVLSFDKVASDDLGAVPTRSSVPDALATRQIVLACMGMVAGTITLFLLLRVGSVWLSRWSAQARSRQSRHRALSAQLNLVADAVIHPATLRDAADARRQEAVASQYVLVLDKVEHARSESELAAAEREVAGLVKKVKA
jgi:hypothetical protein